MSNPSNDRQTEEWAAREKGQMGLDAQIDESFGSESLKHIQEIRKKREEETNKAHTLGSISGDGFARG